MIIDSIDYESNQVTLSIVNESDYTFTYDSVYYVETKKDSDWYTLNPDQYFDALGYVLPPNSSIELTIELEDVLKTGEHRIVKSVSVEQHTYYLSSTFIVP
ncbi:immunoglobulin-like domain-containing protein [Allofournierella massiliensis]|uniref:immunoglobulin-like domain-containing protein n=1 Tax=Allofournierella massiliensis TaxID=1650663 RepID=UPI0025A3A69C|nr:immunoglobulin-like domain-containing protein [Fournierella massiliensis]